MIESNVCDNCICVPVCMNRSPISLIRQCSIYRDVVDNLLLESEYHKITISVNALNKCFIITCHIDRNRRAWYTAKQLTGG